MARRTVTIILSILLAQPLSGQIRGVVTDTGGVPLADVMVELWAPGSRAGVTRTDASGGFSFTSAEAGAANGISFTRIGYRSSRLSLLRTVAELRVRLEVLPVPLPDLTVAASAPTCPVGDEPAARRLWGQVARRYSKVTGARGIALRAGVATEELVPPGRVGWIDEGRLDYVDRRRVGATSQPTPGRYRDLDHSIRREGYAVRGRAKRPAWHYWSLEGEGAHHFASDVFAARHTFFLLREDPHEFVLGFCPRSERQPEIRGTLVLGPDTSFVSAEWGFVTPKPRERAGGYVVFTPRRNGTGDPPHLLAARGAFWREQGMSGTYFQKSAVFTAWTVSETDSMPRLPVDGG